MDVPWNKPSSDKGLSPLIYGNPQPWLIPSRAVLLLTPGDLFLSPRLRWFPKEVPGVSAVIGSPSREDFTNKNVDLTNQNCCTSMCDASVRTIYFANIWWNWWEIRMIWVDEARIQSIQSHRHMSQHQYFLLQTCVPKNKMVKCIKNGQSWVHQCPILRAISLLLVRYINHIPYLWILVAGMFTNLAIITDYHCLLNPNLSYFRSQFLLVKYGGYHKWA